MKVLLIKDVYKLGRAGDIKKVAVGYGRNYLIPIDAQVTDEDDLEPEAIEAARAEGLSVTADVYTYPAGATGLNASMPPWVQEGGFEASLERLQDPALRKRIADEMLLESDEWENMYLGVGSPDNILLVTDGLPTQGRDKPSSTTVSADQRLRHFQAAVRTLPSGALNSMVAG